MPKRKQTPSQLANLHPFGTRAESIERKVQSKGGQKRAEGIAEKKTIRQWLEVMGAMKANPEIAAKMQKMFPEIKVAQFTNDAAMAARMYNDAIVKGDARAQSNIADIKGEKVTKQEIEIKEPRKFVFVVKK